MSVESIKNMKKLQKFVYGLLGCLVLLSLIAPVQVQAANTLTTTIGNIKITTTDDASSSLTPNIPVNLYFALENTNFPGQAFNCSAGKKLFFILKHWTGESSYDFFAAQQSQYPVYAFNSGNSGQLNKYQGIYYCNADYLSGVQASVFQSNLNTLKNSTGQVWEGSVWNKTTGGAVAVVITPSKTVYQPNDKLTMTISNLPAGVATASITINGKSTPAPALISGPKSFPLVIGTADGFKAEGDNTVKVELKDSTGNLIPLSGSSFVIKTGPVGSGGTTPPPGGETPGGGNGTPSVVATDKLYNPLPESELTKMFLLLTRGFLMIIGVWGVMFIIVGGFRMVTAAGNEEQILAAKKTITWAILGVIVAIMSFSIIALVQNFVTDKEIIKVNTSN